MSRENLSAVDTTMGTEHGRDRRILRRSLRAGALYDWALGSFMLIAGPAALCRLGHPLEDPALYWFRLSSLPLFVLPVLYMAAARSAHLDAFRLPVLAMRGLGGALVLASLALGPEPSWLVWAVGLGDLAWAGLYAVLWNREARIG